MFSWSNGCKLGPLSLWTASGPEGFSSPEIKNCFGRAQSYVNMYKWL